MALATPAVIDLSPASATSSASLELTTESAVASGMEGSPDFISAFAAPEVHPHDTRITVISHTAPAQEVPEMALSGVEVGTIVTFLAVAGGYWMIRRTRTAYG